MKKFIYLTAIVGALGISAGAFGAHALKDTLSTRGNLSTWNTAVLYNIIHAPALLAASLYMLVRPSAGLWLSRASVSWAIGVGLFSGSLYWLALGGPRWLGPVTPLGGLFLISGWLCTLGAAGKLSSESGKSD